MRKPVVLLGLCELALGVSLGLPIAPASGDVTVDAHGLLVTSRSSVEGGSGVVGSFSNYEVMTSDGVLIHSTNRPVLNSRLMSLSHQSTRVALWDEVRADGSIANMYAASIDGRPYSMPTEASKLIQMRTASFDPSREAAALPAELEASPDHRVFMVQFASAYVPAYGEEIAALGGEVRRFVPDSAQLVEMGGDAVAAVEALPFVRGVTPYHPGYKIDEQILMDRFGWNAVAQVPVPAAINAMPATQREWYNMLVLAEDAGQQAFIASEVNALGGSVIHAEDSDVLVTVELDAAQLAAIAGLSEVLWIDRWTPASDDMDIVRQTGGANMIEATYGFTGQGVRGEVMDGNVLTTHISLQSPPMILTSSVSGSMSHGTPVSGIIFGDGTDDAGATGLAPSAQGFFSSYTTVSNRAAHTASLLGPSIQASFQSNSWGNAVTTQYTSLSSQLDTILFNNDITLTQSQSNQGSQNSRPQAWAKNIISVGGLNHYGNTNDADDCWCGYASRGPAADGRIKPDIALYYDNIYTTSSMSDDSYGSFCCTSAATPSVAGHIALMLQMWHEGVITGYGASGETVFESRPSSALVKALLVHSAQQWTISGGVDSDRDRFRQGWGRPSLVNLHNMRNDMFIIDEGDDPILPLETKSWTFESDGSGKANVTLVYRDPAGSPSAGVHRVNNLSLRVTSPLEGVVFWGNNGMHGNNFTVPYGEEDTINTVERVQVNSAIPGTWVVEVIASEINQDGNPATFGVIDSNYALVVSGLGQPVQPGGCDADLNGDGMVNADDLGLLLNDFGTASTATDLNGDGIINADDLSILLNNFGGCN